MRQPRYIKARQLYEVMARTVGGRRLFRPAPELRDDVLGVIGRAQHLYPVQLHEFKFMSNHHHMMLTPTEGDAVSPFMGHINRNTALLAKEHCGYRGRVWARYSIVPILDDLAAERRLRYILSNGVKEGLVASPLEWPGASADEALLSGASIPARWRHRVPGRTRRHIVETDDHEITLTPLPGWQHLTAAQRRAKVQELVDDIVMEGAMLRSGRPPLGVAGILAQDPFATVPLDESPVPLAHWSNPEVFEQFRADLREFHGAYRVASDARRRRRAVDVLFPSGSFPSPPPFER